MVPLRCLAVLAHFLFTLGVSAGNRAWEPAVKPRTESIQITVRDVSGAHNVYANRSQAGVVKRADIARQYTRNHVNSHAHDHEKRWFGLPSSREAGAPYLWPQGNIRACFENAQHMHEGVLKTTEQILSVPLQGARELWRQAGLDDKNGWFHFDVITNNPTYCSENNRNDRHEFLLIKYAGQGIRNMATSTGMPAELDPSPDRFPEPYTFDELGPRMTLSDDPDMGQKNVVANFAHEMGVSSCIRSVACHNSLTLQFCSTHGVFIMSIKIPSGGKGCTLAPSGADGSLAQTAGITLSLLIYLDRR